MKKQVRKVAWNLIVAEGVVCLLLGFAVGRQSATTAIRTLEEQVVREQPVLEWTPYQIQIIFTARLNNGRVEIMKEQVMASSHK